MEPGSWCWAQPQRPIEGEGGPAHCGPLCEMTIVSLSSWAEMHILAIFIIYLIEQKNFSEEVGCAVCSHLTLGVQARLRSPPWDKLEGFLPEVEVTAQNSPWAAWRPRWAVYCRPLSQTHATATVSWGNLISCALAVCPMLLGQRHTFLSEGLPGSDEPPRRPCLSWLLGGQQLPVSGGQHVSGTNEVC